MKSSASLILVAVVVFFTFSFACGDDDGESTPDSATDSELREEREAAGIRTARGDGVQALVASVGGTGNSRIAAGGDQLYAAMPASGGAGSAGIANAGGGAFAGDSAGSSDSSALQQQDGSGGLTVQGYGSAEQDADGALLDFTYNRNNGYWSPPSPAPSPVTEEDLQQVIDALVEAGVPRDDIELPSGSPYYYDYYSVILRATISDLDILADAVAAGSDASTGISGLSFQSATVTYTVDNCTSLREAALDEAVADADERGRLLARALGVGFGPVDSASDYNWWGYGSGNCGQNNNYYWGYYYGSGMPFVEGQPMVVQSYQSISVTYSIQ